MSIGIIVQARMGSTRLPGKVLMEINGKPMLDHMIKRLQVTGLPIVVVTSCEKRDEPIVSWCIRNGVNYFLGSELDVLKRYFDCAINNKFTTIIRVTADCPLIDPFQLLRCFYTYEKCGYDFVTNRGPNTRYPDGIDVEIFSRKLLWEAHTNAYNPLDREHVTPWMLRHTSILELPCLEDYSSYRYTVDTKEDFDLVMQLFKRIEETKIFGTYEEVICLMNEKTEEII
jgi:spore coat polysaccharide biosynthesis protein SpsF